MLTFVQKDPTGRVVRTAVVMERKNNNSRFNRLPLDVGRLNPPPVMTREKHLSAKGGCSLEYYTQKKKSKPYEPNQYRCKYGRKLLLLLEIWFITHPICCRRGKNCAQVGKGSGNSRFIILFCSLPGRVLCEAQLS